MGNFLDDFSDTFSNVLNKITNASGDLIDKDIAFFRSIGDGDFKSAILTGLSFGQASTDTPSIPATPDVPSSLSGESGSPTYSLERANRKRPGEPVPVLYGTHRVVPDLISSPFLFRGDNLYGSAIYYYSNMAITCGTIVYPYNGASFKIGEEPVPMGIFSDYEISIDTVFSIGEANSQPETAIGYLIANTFSGYWIIWEPLKMLGPVGDQADLKIGFVFPNGLYEISGGNPISRSVVFEIVKEIINISTGSIVSSSMTTVTVTAASLKTYYYAHTDLTNSFNPSMQRAQIKVRRTTPESTSITVRDAVQICALTGYTSHYYPQHPSVSVIAIKKRFDIDGQNHKFGAFSMIAQRCLPVWNGSTWSAPTQTRSIAWALADVLRNTNYGVGLDDSEIDLQKLLELDAVWTARGDYFDGVFDQTITVWEALTRIARAGRATPVLNGGVVTFVRDDAQSVRTAIFGPENILPGSLSIEYRIADANEPDGVRVSYIDPTTWQEATTDYQITGGTPLDPREVSLFGCTDSDMALREATYQARVDAYRRQTITWQTEFDALLVSVGKMVGLAHDVPGWGVSCEITDLSGSIVTTSESLWFGPIPFTVSFRQPDGSVAGPFTATMITGELKRFSFAGSLGFTPITELSGGVRTMIVAGVPKDIIVTAIKSIGPTTFEISGVPYDARVYAAGA